MIDGIDRLALAQELEVQMRAGRAAGAADKADELAAHHRLARLDAGRESREMAVDRGKLAAVLDADPVAVAAVGRGAHHHAVGRGIVYNDAAPPEIYALVHEH